MEKKTVAFVVVDMENVKLIAENHKMPGSALSVKMSHFRFIMTHALFFLYLLASIKIKKVEVF